MKNSIYLLALIVFSTLILSNTPVKEATRFVMTVVGEEPILPDIPYAYNSVDIPEHLMPNINGTMNDTIGYTTVGVDTTVFPLINNDAATLGRVLFYDTKLSMTEDISCGSCHDQSASFAQNVALSEGANMATMRNSMHLNDLGWSNREHFGWDMSHPNLESILSVPFLDVNELGIDANDLLMKLNASTYYPGLFEEAFGTQNIELPMVITALADFIKSMNTFNSRLDQAASNNFADFSDSELNGMEIFRTSCSNCHIQGDFFVGFIDIPFSVLEIFPEIFNNGLPIQNEDIGAGHWNAVFSGLFKAPSLRNIEVTGPYMHDGRFETLEEVIDHYSEGIEENEWNSTAPNPLANFEFTDTEKADLKAFLLTLTDESFLTDPKWSDPFETPSSTHTNLIESVVLKPNPMSEIASISFNNDGGELVNITIHSNDGRLIRQDQIQSNEYVIEKNNFTPGIYYVKMVMGKKTSTQKLIVQ